MQWFLATKVGRWLAIAGAIVVAALAVRWKWMADGRRQEREDQKDRNDAARKEAEDARDRALGVDDPRRRLLERFRRADGQG